MTLQEDTTRLYKADSGCLIVRKADNAVVGKFVDIGDADDISNYEDRHFTDDYIASFLQSVGEDSWEGELDE